MSSSAIRCIVDIFVKPEAVEKLRAILLTIAEQSRSEDGCLEYNLLENVHDKFQFTIMEKWENEEAFEDHLQSDHIRQASMGINDDLSKAADIKRYKHIKVTAKNSNSKQRSRFCTLI